MQLAALDGDVLWPGDLAYEAKRRTANALADPHPAAIVRAGSVRDVVAAVRAAGRSGLRVRVRAGGHRTGPGDTPGELLVDLARLHAVTVDAAGRTARVQGGAVWEELDESTQRVGLAAPGAPLATVGVAGFALHGGHGWLSPALGPACAAVVAAEVVTADGAVVRASEDEHPDLLWALRGGGGGLGVVVELRLRLAPVGPLVLAGSLVVPASEGAAVVALARDVAAAAPPDLAVAAVLTTAPPDPALPPALRERPVAELMVCAWGERPASEAAVRELRRRLPGAHGEVAPRPYADWQRVFEDARPFGLPAHHRGRAVVALPDAAIDALVAAALPLRSPLSQLVVVPFGPALRAHGERTAWAGRDAAATVHAVALWPDPDPGESALQAAWADAVAAALAPWGRTGGAAGAERERRLDAVRRTWDPDGRFGRDEDEGGWR